MTDTRAALADEAVPRLLEALADPIMGRMLRERLAERGVLLVTEERLRAAIWKVYGPTEAAEDSAAIFSALSGEVTE
jgi:hypothetical protein